MAQAVPVSNSRFATASCAIAALGTAKTRGVAAPASGTVVAILFAFDVAIDDVNTLTGKINGTAITGGSKAVSTAEGAAGKCIQIFPTAANTCKRGDYLSLDTDGGGTVGDGTATFVIDQK